MIPRMSPQATLAPVRWVVTGAAGMLGHDMAAVVRDRGDDVRALDRRALDVRDLGACRAAVDQADVVVNCAGWTDVDGAEGDEASAFAVNAVGASNVARACNELGAMLVQLSTDYVFRGDASEPYLASAPLSPLNAYGRTKAAAEWAVRAECPASYIVRTAWLYGVHGPSFVRTMLRLAAEKEQIEVVDDQLGQPTWTVDVARLIVELVIEEAPFGIHHGTSTGSATWYEFAQAVFAQAGLDPQRVVPITSDRLQRTAARPAYSVLANDGRMATWQDALGRAMPVFPGS